MQLNVYSITPTDTEGLPPVDYISNYCTTSNTIISNGDGYLVKLTDGGSCTHPDAVFVGTEEIV